MQPTEKIGRRKLKAQRLAQAVADPSRTLADVGRELYPNAEHPSQTVSNCLKQPGPQAELKKLQAKLYDEQTLKTKLQEVLDDPTNQTVKLRAIELGMRNLAMLTDKVQDVTDRANVRELQAEADTVLSSLTVSTDGIRPGNAIPAKANTDKGQEETHR